MSANNIGDAGGMNRCANCDVAQGNGVNLKTCTACHLVKYCGVKCQKEHRPKHKRACKEHAAELKDEILFKQPESTHMGDCPICFLPLPIDEKQSVIMICCSKSMCIGCFWSLEIAEGDEKKCPFCRKPISGKTTKESQAEVHAGEVKQLNKRAKVNGPYAMREEGVRRITEDGDYQGAMTYLNRGAELGDATCHFQLGNIFYYGEGVEEDESKAVFHWEQSAIGGHPRARHNLGVVETDHGNFERAAKHFIIAAKLAHDKALDELKLLYNEGKVSKDDFAGALRGHQAAVDATKSPQRALAEKEFTKIGVRQFGK